MTTKELENYEPKGQLEGFPKEIIARMLECQEEQGNKRDVTVFEILIRTSADLYGFSWNKTKEGYEFWYEVIDKKDFNLFFEKYPKKDNQYNSQEFKVGDKVINIITGRIGEVTYINTLNKYPLFVKFSDEKRGYFTLNGRDLDADKHPRLLHYRDDYNYDIIDFNNLPKRWRAEVGEKYYYLDVYFDVHSFIEEYSNTDTKLYNLGKYFKTKEEAQEVADKLKEYFKQLINK